MSNETKYFWYAINTANACYEDIIQLNNLKEHKKAEFFNLDLHEHFIGLHQEIKHSKYKCLMPLDSEQHKAYQEVVDFDNRMFNMSIYRKLHYYWYEVPVTTFKVADNYIELQKYDSRNYQAFLEKLDTEKYPDYKPLTSLSDNLEVIAEMDRQLYDNRQIKYIEIQDKTRQHIQNVSRNNRKLLIALDYRIKTHDNSKLYEPEITYFMDFLNKVKEVKYNSEEYLELVNNHKYTKTHFRNNSHHPEHYENGINGMDLIDIVEMLCDWLSAKNRNMEEVEIKDFIKIQQDRYKFSDELKNILINTYERFLK